MEKAARKNLLTIATVYAKARGWSLATVSKEVHGSSKFFDDFRKGNVSTTLAKMEQMLLEFGRLYREGGLSWPAMQPILMTPPPNKKVEKTP